MAANSQKQMVTPIEIEPGRLLEVKIRSVQKMSGSSKCLGVNISQIGRAILGVEAADSVQLVVHDNGIWIQTNE